MASEYVPYPMWSVVHEIGNRNYELNNHLGNVLSVISDKVIPIDEGGTTTFLADIRQSTDYSPFGVTLENRNLKLLDPVSGNPVKRLRNGFQGQEMDDELKGEGNSLNYEYRMNDPRLGRFFKIDPLVGEYPYYTPYAFSGNRVIDCKELEGLEPININPQTGKKVISTIDCHVKNNSILSNVGDDLSPEIQTQLNVITDVVVIVGGIVVTVGSCGTGTPAYIAITGVLTGSYAFASGSAKLTADLSGNEQLKDLGEKIPGSYLDATIGLTLEYSVKGEKYKDEIQVARSALNLAENLLTLDLDMFRSLPKNAVEITDLNITIYSIGTGVNDLKTKINGLNTPKAPNVKTNSNPSLLHDIMTMPASEFDKLMKTESKPKAKKTVRFKAGADLNSAVN